MQNVFAGLATENAVCTSQSIDVEEAPGPVPCNEISTDAAPGPATRNLKPCPPDPLTTASTSSADQLSPLATAKLNPVTSPKLADPLVQSAATRPYLTTGCASISAFSPLNWSRSCTASMNSSACGWVGSNGIKEKDEG